MILDYLLKLDQKMQVIDYNKIEKLMKKSAPLSGRKSAQNLRGSSKFSKGSQKRILMRSATDKNKSYREDFSKGTFLLTRYICTMERPTRKYSKKFNKNKKSRK